MNYYTRFLGLLSRSFPNTFTRFYPYIAYIIDNDMSFIIKKKIYSYPFLAVFFPHSFVFLLILIISEYTNGTSFIIVYLIILPIMIIIQYFIIRNLCYRLLNKLILTKITQKRKEVGIEDPVWMWGPKVETVKYNNQIETIKKWEI